MAQARPPLENIPPDWNPMQEHFVNPKLNAYDALSYHQQPGYKAAMKMGGPAGDNITSILTQSVAPSYQLHVSGIPIGVTEAGVRNIFSPYGTVRDIEMPKKLNIPVPNSTTWARVTFATMDEAQNALENIHRRPPHHLNVMYALSNEERARRAQEDQMIQMRGEEITSRHEAFQRTKGIVQNDEALHGLSGRAQHLTVRSESKC